jgi:ATP-binding cassette, subfamily B, bacterial
VPAPDRSTQLFKSLLKPHWKALALGLVAVLIEAASDLLQPWPLKVVFDNVLSKRSPHGHGWLNHLIVKVAGTNPPDVLKFAVVAALGIAVVGAIASYAEKYVSTSVGQWVMHDLRLALYSHIQRLSLAFHDQKQTGDLISRVTSDIDAVQSFIVSGLLGAIINTLTLVGMVVVMLYMNWQFTLIALAVAPPLFVVIYTYTRRIKKASREVRKKEGEIVSVIQEVLTSIRVVKAFAREDYEQRRLEEESLESVDLTMRARGMKARLLPIVEILVAIGTCLAIWFGVHMVMASTLSAGGLIVFMYYLDKMMYKPMQELSKMTDAYSKAMVGYERIREVLDTDREVRDLPGARRAPKFRGEISFEHVSFGYDASNPVLRDINFHVEPGQVAALVGPTGAGKTTLISLIARFYDPTEGIVRIDGSDVKRFTQRSLRRQISFVLQETLLFHGPVWSNIAYGKPDASRAEILHASEIANAHEFIEKMPQGYNTLVGERGATLSGGQRQRIAIARAVLRDSPILILDEPTTGLDAASEKLVFDALDRLMVGKTAFVIAHRLSTIRRADIILVVKGGGIVERGTHDELMKRGGLYAELHDLQFGGENIEGTAGNLVAGQ